MTLYQHLLCPIDFSDVSRAALAWSIRFSKELEAELTVLHVLDTGLMHVGNLVAVPDALEELRQRVRTKMHDWQKELGLSPKQIKIVEGVPDDTIASTANDGDVDLLVMGTHGLSGFRKLLLGSVTEKVLHRARVPLLTIAPGAASGGRLAGPEAPEKILLAIDFGPESQSVVRHGVWLAEHYGAELIAAHVVPVPYVVLNDRTLERMTPEQLERLEESLTAERRQELEALIPDSTGVSKKILTAVGSPFETLREMAKAQQIGLVVMGAGGHGESGLSWLGSTCHKMVRSAACPVLVVR